MAQKTARRSEEIARLLRAGNSPHAIATRCRCSLDYIREVQARMSKLGAGQSLLQVLTR